MNPRSLVVLIVATLVLLAVTVVTLRSRESSVRGDTGSEKLFPALMPAINDVATVEVRHKGTETTLQRKDGAWGVAQKSDYPVDFEPVKKLLIALAELTTVEAKTSDPERYAKIGVQEPGPDSDSSLVTVKGAGGETLASLIVGKAHEGKGGLGSGRTYVRKPGEAQSWLVKGELELQESPEGWLQKEILKIPRDRIRAITITHPAGADGAAGEVVRVDRATAAEQNFTLHDIPAGKELSYPTVAGSMANALEWLNLEDVVPASTIDFTTGAGPVARFETFDGLVLTVRTKDQDAKTYARFEASFVAPAAAEPAADASAALDDAAKPATKSAEEVQKEVLDLERRLAQWAFVIPAYNKTSFAKKMSELVKDPAPPAGDGAGFDGAPAGDGGFQMPDGLPPGVEEQLRKQLEAQGQKPGVVTDPPPPPADDHAGHDHGQDAPPPAPTPPEQGAGDTPPPQ